MKKRITSLLLVLAMCFAMLPTAAFAADDEGSTMPAYSGGSGTQDDPYLLANKQDILSLHDFLVDNEDATLDRADNCGLGAYHGYYFKLTDDIDMSGVEWTPFNFNGVLDGAGHTISNMQMNQNMFDTADPAEGEYKSQQYEAGFFSRLVHAHIRNLYFENCAATISDNLDPATQRDIYVGIVAGTAIASGFENISVVNCTVTQNGKTDNFGYAGGLVAAADSCYFNGCSFQNGQINVGGNAADNHTGGIAGVILDEKHAYMAEDSAFGMYQCFSTANINVTDSKYGTGGLVGWAICDELTDIYQDCYVGGSIVSNSDSVAGLIGGCSSKAEVKNCIVYADTITASKTVDPIHSPSNMFPDFDKATVTNCKLSDQTVIKGTNQTNNASISASSLTESEKQVPAFKSNLHGQLLDKTKGVELTLSQDGTTRYTTVTDENGKYNFGKQVLSGAYTLDIADDSSYDAYTTSVSIDYASNTLLNITRKVPVVPVDAINLNTNTLSLTRGATATLTATVTPDNATDKTVTWTSADEKVVTVENGIVTAVGNGTTTITAGAGDKTAVCTVTVTTDSSSSGSSSSGGSSKPSYSVTAPGTTENGSVTVSPKNATKGSTVTVTVKPNDGYQLDKLTVADAKGNTISVTDKGNGKYTFTMPASKVTVTPKFVKIAQQPTKKTFVDVDKSDWFADAVAYVTEKGLMNGTGSDTFSPNASTTRGMLMTVLARYAGEDTTGSTPWYQKGMEWAKANGVSDGTNPEVNITREQLVTMLYRYVGSPKANGSLDSFSDAASVSSDAVNAMQWAVANGIVNGSNGKLNPQNNATRAQVAAILMRFCEMSK